MSQPEMRRMWYQVVFRESERFQKIGMSTASTIIYPWMDWDDVRGLLIATLNQLRGYDKSQIWLYEDENCFNEKRPMNRLSELIGKSIGADEMNPIIVLTHGETAPSRISSRMDICNPGMKHPYDSETGCTIMFSFKVFHLQPERVSYLYRGSMKVPRDSNVYKLVEIVKSKYSIALAEFPVDLLRVYVDEVEWIHNRPVDAHAVALDTFGGRRSFVVVVPTYTYDPPDDLRG